MFVCQCVCHCVCLYVCNCAYVLYVCMSDCKSVHVTYFPGRLIKQRTSFFFPEKGLMIKSLIRVRIQQYKSFTLESILEVSLNNKTICQTLVLNSEWSALFVDSLSTDSHLFRANTIRFLGKTLAKQHLTPKNDPKKDPQI